MMPTVARRPLLRSAPAPIAGAAALHARLSHAVLSCVAARVCCSRHARRLCHSCHSRGRGVRVRYRPARRGRGARYDEQHSSQANDRNAAPRPRRQRSLQLHGRADGSSNNEEQQIGISSAVASNEWATEWARHDQTGSPWKLSAASRHRHAAARLFRAPHLAASLATQLQRAHLQRSYATTNLRSTRCNREKMLVRWSLSSLVCDDCDLYSFLVPEGFSLPNIFNPVTDRADGRDQAKVLVNLVAKEPQVAYGVGGPEAAVEDTWNGEQDPESSASVAQKNMLKEVTSLEGLIAQGEKILKVRDTNTHRRCARRTYASVLCIQLTFSSLFLFLCLCPGPPPQAEALGSPEEQACRDSGRQGEA